jgi:signal transduction histidine kinase
LNNAYRFTQQGGFILLDISCHDALAATFTVQDSGYGMSED